MSRSSSAALDSAALTKPTGSPTTKAGRTCPPPNVLHQPKQGRGGVADYKNSFLVQGHGQVNGRRGTGPAFIQGGPGHVRVVHQALHPDAEGLQAAGGHAHAGHIGVRNHGPTLPDGLDPGRKTLGMQTALK